MAITAILNCILNDNHNNNCYNFDKQIYSYKIIYIFAIITKIYFVIGEGICQIPWRPYGTEYINRTEGAPIEIEIFWGAKPPNLRLCTSCIVEFKTEIFELQLGTSPLVTTVYCLSITSLVHIDMVVRF